MCYSTPNGVTYRLGPLCNFLRRKFQEKCKEEPKGIFAFCIDLHITFIDFQKWHFWSTGAPIGPEGERWAKSGFWVISAWRTFLSLHPTHENRSEARYRNPDFDFRRISSPWSTVTLCFYGHFRILRCWFSMLHDFSGTPTTRTEMLWKNRKNGQNPIQNQILHHNSAQIDRIGLYLDSLDRTRRDEAACSVLFFCDLPLQRIGRKIDFVIFRASLQRNYAFASGFSHCN